MSKKFKGRVVLSGSISGNATVSRQAFNTSGSYMENMFAGRTDAAPCTDASNKELFGKDLSGAILCVPTTVGSTMGGMCLMGMKATRCGPGSPAVLETDRHAGCRRRADVGHLEGRAYCHG